jgi:hypothetical protein
MSSLGAPALAGGDIRPCRFVKQSASEDYNLLEADANDPLVGISQSGTNVAPIPNVTSDKAAIAGQQFRVHRPGESCLLELGGTVAAGDRLKSDADGKGVAIATSGTTPQRYGGVAMQAGVSGEKIQVEVQIGVESPA